MLWQVSCALLLTVGVSESRLIPVGSQEISANSMLWWHSVDVGANFGIAWAYTSLSPGHQRYFLLPFFLFWGEFSLQSKKILNLFYVLFQILWLRVLQFYILLITVEHCVYRLQVFQMTRKMVSGNLARRHHSFFCASVSHSGFNWGGWSRIGRNWISWQQWPFWKSAIQILDISFGNLCFLANSESIPWCLGSLGSSIGVAFFKHGNLSPLSV